MTFRTGAAALSPTTHPGRFQRKAEGGGVAGVDAIDFIHVCAELF